MSKSFFFFLILLCFLLTIKLSVVLLVSAQTPQCLDEGSFTPNSTFHNNRLLLLSSLPLNLTAQNSFFYNASLGQDPDTVYALAMCIPSAETEDCSNCLKTTSDTLINNCTHYTQAFHWSNDETTLCFVRYSNRSFFGSADMDPRQILPNATDIESDLTGFHQVWQDLMLHMLDSASSKYYDAEIRPVKAKNSKDTKMIYTIMQCTCDVSYADCNTCLRNNVGDFQNCCLGKQGGLVTRPNCFFRWEFYPFYQAFRNISPPAKKDSPVVKIVVPTLVIAFLLASVVGCVIYWIRKRKNDRAREAYQEFDTAEVDAVSSLKFEFRTVQAATSDFSTENKLGEGGFGPVYKGKLQNGQEIAVKRLAIRSGQGDEEFKNEVLLLSKLQHKNLVKLLGFCIQGEEKLLIYEFVPNSSLDHFIFDEASKQPEHFLSLRADWSTRYIIIGNIARGILYLHEDSRLKIIHRDLKPSNILLDCQMNPKIADFGMARLFDSDDQTQGLTTSRVMGTYGYMAPEYIAQGRFSAKTDVYSYGIMVLEIICGEKNNSFQPSGVGFHAWMKWREDRALDIVDSVMTKNVSKNEMMKCINIGLLCVQESVARRPNMSSVVHWLNSNSVTLPVPSTPAFVIHGDSSEASRASSLVNVSITELEPR